MDLDPFDLICHIAFEAKPLTRRERAEIVKKRDVSAKYGDHARAVPDALLAKYADEGVINLDDARVLRIPPLNTLGTPLELVRTDGHRCSLHSDSVDHRGQSAGHSKATSGSLTRFFTLGNFDVDALHGYS